MTRGVSRRPVTSEVNPYGIYGGHTATAAGFTRVLQFSSISIISWMLDTSGSQSITCL